MSISGSPERKEKKILFISVPVAVVSLTAYPVAGETVRVKVVRAVQIALDRELLVQQLLLAVVVVLQ